MRHKTAADYAAIAVAPVLIFVMIASLASFLGTVMYRGGYSGRIQYILMMFTMGAVAIARLAIENNRAHSLGYAAGLGAATFVVMARFVGNPVISLISIVVIGVLADVIVRDCTLIDDDADSSDKGLLESGLRGLFSGSKGGHQPGRTVLMLAIAALPLFGVGQFFLGGNTSAWADAQKFLALYLFAALSLLVTTSFLGLRRYLRQRGAEMPVDVSVAWLGGGVAMIAAILLIAAVVPLPGSAIANFEVPDFLMAKSDQSASRRGWGNEGTGNQDKKSDQPGDAKKITDPNVDGDDPASQKGAKSGAADSGDRKDGSPGAKGGGDAKGAAKGKGEQKSAEKKQSPGKQQNGDQQKGNQPKSDPKNGGNKSQESKNQESKSQEAKNQNSGDRDSSQAKSEPESESESRPEQKTESSSDQPSAEPSDRDRDKTPQSNQEQQKQQRDSRSSQKPSSQKPSSPTATPPSLVPSASAIGGLIKALILIGCVGVVVWFVRKHAAEIAAWWRSWRQKPSTELADDEPANRPPEPVKRARPFSSFHNPFDTTSSPSEAIVTTFSALQSFATEHGIERGDDETPAEFQRRLVAAMPELATPTAGVIDAYNRLVYGGGASPQDNEVADAKKLWKTMISTRRSPV